MIEQLLKLNQAVLDQNHNLGCPDKKEWAALVKLAYREVSGVPVEQLPTLDEALTIKTKKQGRISSIKELMSPNTNNIRGTSSGVELVTKRIKICSPEEMRLTAKTIVNHKNASPKRKAVAQDFLDTYEHITSENIAQWAKDSRDAMSYEYGEYQKACSLIRSIARSLTKYFKN